MNVLVVDDGDFLRGYDCRDVLRIEEIQPPLDRERRITYRVRLGRLGRRKEVRCREIVGFYEMASGDIRPLPEVVKERITGEVPRGVGITDRGLCVLY